MTRVAAGQRPTTMLLQVKAKELAYDGEDDEPIDYFVNMLPRLKKRAKDRGLRQLCFFVFVPIHGRVPDTQSMRGTRRVLQGTSDPVPSSCMGPSRCALMHGC